MRRLLTGPGVKATLAAAVLLLAASVARGSYLYWSTTEAHTSSTRTCLSFAANSMRVLRFANIHQGPIEVAGTSGGAYAAVTCVATSPRVTAVVMVSGDNGPEAVRVREALRAKIAGTVQFD